MIYRYAKHLTVGSGVRIYIKAKCSCRFATIEDVQHNVEKKKVYVSIKTEDGDKFVNVPHRVLI